MTIKSVLPSYGIDRHLFQTEKVETPEISEVMQHADVKISKVAFAGNETSQIIFLGKSRGRCISLWKRDPESVDPYKILSTKDVDVDPNDICTIGPNKVCVGFADGSLAVLNTDKESITLLKRIQSVHRGCASRVVCRFDDSVLSASSSGSLELVDVETGTSSTVFSGQSGIQSMCTTFGGHLVVTGNSNGEVTVWDLRQNNGQKLQAPLQTLIPSKKALDAVTALCSHPAQSNLICCGTDNGILGLIDARNGSNACVAGTYLVANKGITQVMFHPTSSDNLLFSSKDGSLVRIDASGAPITLGSTTRSVKDNVWLHGDISSSLRTEPIKTDSVYGTSSFDCRGDTIVASTSIGLISAYENLPFFPTNTFGKY